MFVRDTIWRAECNEKYCPPFFQIHVDTPESTLLKDQPERGDGPKGK